MNLHRIRLLRPCSRLRAPFQASGLLLATGAVLALVCAGSAQIPLGTQAENLPRVAFHLPAGDYSIGELIDQAEQACRGRITRPAEFAASGDVLHLQTPLALDEEGWQAVIGTMLWSRGLLLVRHAAQHTFEVLPTPAENAPWIAELAEDCTAADLFGKHPFGPVRVTLPLKESVERTRNLLSSPAALQTRGCEVGGAPGAITVTGLGHDVRHALERVQAALPGLLPAPRPPRAWPRAAGEPVELRRGTYAARELVDLLAHTLHRNVLVGKDGEFLTAPIDVAVTQQVDPLRLEEVVTKLLWEVGIFVVELVPQRELYQVIAIDEGRRVTGHLLAAPVAVPMAPSELLARQDLVAFISVTLPLQHVTPKEARAVWEELYGVDVRLGLNGRPKQSFCRLPDLQLTGTSFPHAQHMQGLTVELLPMIARLAQLEASAERAK